MSEILTITVNPAFDLSTEAPAVIPDQKLRCTVPLIHPGGGGVNVSRAISNLGGSSQPLIAYGGHTGEALVQMLRDEGLSPQSLGIPYPTRESVSVRDAANGLQYRFMMPGETWTDADAATARHAILKALQPGSLVVPSGSLPPGLPLDFFLDLNSDVTAAGGRMIVDTSGPALKHAADAGAGLYVLRMDLAEARDLSGEALHDITDLANLAQSLRDAQVAEIVMIAADAQGTVINTPDWCGLTRPPLVVPVSKIGGGDSFIGAFTLAIARGQDPVAACAWGTAAAASAVTAPGTDLCNRADTERYLDQVLRSPLQIA
ncbi:MAG: PfkB family carbohydrate kinase [Pseudomonadota bacterium]